GDKRPENRVNLVGNCRLRSGQSLPRVEFRNRAADESRQAAHEFLVRNPRLAMVTCDKFFIRRDFRRLTEKPFEPGEVEIPQRYNLIARACHFVTATPGNRTKNPPTAWPGSAGSR